jgi:hypothetical protein
VKAGSGALPPALDPFAEPVTYAPGLRVSVSGTGVNAGQWVEIGGEWSRIEADAAGHLTFALPQVQAGCQPVTLGVDGPQPGDPPVPIPAAASPKLVVRPDLVSVTKVGGGTAVRASARPDLEPGQQVALNLMSDATSGNEPGMSMRLTARVEQRASSIELAIRPQRHEGRYLATIEVDGVSSLPVFKGGAYVGPKVTLG